MDQVCDQCGIKIPGEMPFGLCPRCALQGDSPGDSGQSIHIPGYDVVRLIGEGGSAEVYECVQLDPAIRCAAVKVLKRPEAEEKRRLLDEIQILGELNHPNIARLLGTGELEDGRLFFAMELCEGQPLDLWLQEENPSLRERIQLLHQLGEAVSYAHQNGVIHRDITPSNVLIVQEAEGRWQPKLIDFGLGRAYSGTASLAREVTMIERRAGTPMWMAPEQLEGADITAQSDQHALALLLAFFLLEKAPLGDAIENETTWSEWSKARQAWTLPATDSLPRTARPLRWVAERGLSLDPAERYPSALDFTNDLAAWLENRPVQAGKGRHLYRLGKAVGNAPGLAIGLTALLIVALVFLNRDSASPPDATNELLINEKKLAELEKLQVQALSKMSQSPGEALQLLDKAAELFPGHPEIEISRSALHALAPEAIELPPIKLPFVASKVVSHPEGWLVEGFQGERLLVSPEGTNQAGSEALPEQAHTEWKSPDKPWRANLLPKGQLEFVDTEDGFFVLRPISVPDTGARIAVDFEKLRVAATSSNPELKRWDISRIGGTREKVKFDPPVAWMAFERDDSNLWLWQRNRIFRGWKSGQQPGFGLPLPFFTDQLDTGSIGENHSRGTAPGSQGTQLIFELQGWRLLGKNRELTAVAGSRDLDFVAFASADGHLLWSLPGQALQSWQTDLPPASILATDHLGQRVLWASDDGSIAWLEPSTRKIIQQYQTSKTPTSASLLDSSNKAPRLAVMAFDDGTIEVREVGSKTPRFIKNLAGQRPGPHAIQVHGCHGGDSFLATLLGQLTLSRFDTETGNELNAPIIFDRGLEFFFLSQDGHLVVAVDQNKSEEAGTLRVRSLKTGLDLIPPLQHPSRLTWANISSNGKALATACEDGSVRRWVLRREEEKE